MSSRAWQIGLLAFCLLQVTANAQSRGEMAAGGGTAGGMGGRGYRSPPAPRYGSNNDDNSGSGGFVTTLGGGACTARQRFTTNLSYHYMRAHRSCHTVKPVHHCIMAGCSEAPPH